MSSDYSNYKDEMNKNISKNKLCELKGFFEKQEQKENLKDEIEIIKEYSERTKISIENVKNLYKAGKLILKRGNNSEYLVENPDYTNTSGKFVKTRNKRTHLTPKKKKRK